MTKITKKIEAQMRKMRKSGLTLKETAEKLHTSRILVSYHTDDESKKRIMERNVKYQKKTGYMKKYFPNRYHNDEEFREKHIEKVLSNYHKRTDKFIREKLCHVCGGKKDKKEFSLCKKCRKIRRDYGRANKDRRNFLARERRKNNQEGIKSKEKKR